MTYAADTGSANTYVASYVPKLPTLIDGMRLTFKAKTANTGASTFAPNGNTAYPLYSHANQALQGGEIIANGLIEVEWNSTLTAWVLCGNSGGALPVAAATQSNHAMPLGQATGRLLNVQYFTSNGTYTPTAGTTSVVVELIGGGGAGGGIPLAAGAGTAGGGGGGGGYGRKRITSGFSGVTVTIGSGGTGVINNTGGSGTTSSFGSLITALGGTGGGAGSTTTSTAIPVGAQGVGGLTTLADVTRKGGGGGTGLISSTFAQGGVGGDTMLAPQTQSSSTIITSVIAGNPAAANSGAGGASAVGLNSGTTASGGNGGSGICIVWEYS
ncbi:hypothetical protein [Rahnella inusitata]|uniref:glycine-rich domain-containing protein n=1 Tax=Rahnella inusitata TaxID=58169 RepID=UPI0039AFB50F